jgi:hypothetical protein
MIFRTLFVMRFAVKGGIFEVEFTKIPRVMKHYGP